MPQREELCKHSPFERISATMARPPLYIRGAFDRERGQHYNENRQMARGQMVRHLFLAQGIVGSNPTAPARLGRSISSRPAPIFIYLSIGCDVVADPIIPRNTSPMMICLACSGHYSELPISYPCHQCSKSIPDKLRMTPTIRPAKTNREINSHILKLARLTLAGSGRGVLPAW